MKVADVMTTDVLTVPPAATLKEVARALAGRGISGVPVVDEDGQVLGVVSEADILAKERADGGAKHDARTAGEAMTSPAIAVTPAHRVDRAAALMLDQAVNRLPVVDDELRLVGIVTRADLVRAFAAGDDGIEREIREEVLLRELWVDPRHFELTVHDGAVELVGAFDSSEQREIAERRIRLVPGVMAVEIREPAAAR